MDSPRGAVRLSAVAVAAGLVAILALSMQDGATAEAAVTQRDGTPFVLPLQQGIYAAQWGTEPVLVVVTTQARLDGVEAVRGVGEATDAIGLPGGLAVFAMSARSNYLGCTGVVNLGLGASKDVPDYDGDRINDGRFLDLCHQGQWDIYHRGAPVQGTPTHGPLAALHIRLHGDGLLASGFDGPVGRQV